MWRESIGMCAVFSCLGGAKKSLKEKKAGSHVKLGERLVMEKRGGRTLLWCQELDCVAAKER